MRILFTFPVPGNLLFAIFWLILRQVAFPLALVSGQEFSKACSMHGKESG